MAGLSGPRVEARAGISISRDGNVVANAQRGWQEDTEGKDSMILLEMCE